MDLTSSRVPLPPTTTLYNYRRKNRDRQVRRPKYHDAKYPFGSPRWITNVDEVPIRPSTCTTYSVNVYHYRHSNVYRTCTVDPRRPVDGKFLVDPEHLRSVNIYEARTTTSTTVVARTPTSLYEREPSPMHAPKGVTAETAARELMHV